jgi:hypothetical protein
MGLVTGDIGLGIGNTAKATTPSISGVSENMVDIYKYNQITFHLNTNGGKPAPSNTMVMGYSGCSHNGMPMWTFYDGQYDGDFDISWRSHHHNHSKHMDVRFGSAMCDGASHKLRWGGDGSTGSWEIVSHGRISAWTSATTKNFFGIQGTGNTETGELQSDVSGAGSAADGGLGSWQMISANTTINGVVYGTWTPTSGGTALGASVASLTGITSDGVVN